MGLKKKLTSKFSKDGIHMAYKHMESNQHHQPSEKCKQANKHNDLSLHLTRARVAITKEPGNSGKLGVCVLRGSLHSDAVSVH